MFLFARIFIMVAWQKSIEIYPSMPFAHFALIEL